MWRPRQSRAWSRTAATTPHVHLAANGSPFRNVGGRFNWLLKRSGRLMATTTTGNLGNHCIALFAVSPLGLAF